MDTGTYYIAYDYGHGDSSTATTTSTWYDDTGTVWINGSSTGDITYRVLKDRNNNVYTREVPVKDYTIEYDPEKKKFIVELPPNYQSKEFKTKREAQRYVKRWENKKKGIKVKKTDIMARYREEAQKKREKAEREARWAAEMERRRVEAARLAEERRLEAIRLEAEREAELDRLELENEEEFYFERLGL